MSDFTVVQFAEDTGTGFATFPNPTTAGNLIVVLFASAGSSTLPTSVTDNNPIPNPSDTFLLYSYGWTYFSRVTGLYLATDIIGGATVVTCSGSTGVPAGSPSVIIAEIEPPAVFNSWGISGSSTESITGAGIDQSGQGSSPGSATINANFGISGTGIRTGPVSITLTLGDAGANHNNASIALIVPNHDVFILASDYYPHTPWTSDGTIIAQTLESNGWAAVLAYKDVPYLEGAGCSGGTPPFYITCGNPPNGQIGQAYTHTFPELGGVLPISFSITAGSLPPGLSLDSSTGIVSGTPTAVGAYWFTITVTDADSNTTSVTCAIGICAGGGNFAFYSRH